MIELMVTVAIIGILATIAISNYFQIRQKAYENMVVSDVRSAASIEEAHYASSMAYKAFGPVTGPAQVDLGGGREIVNVSDHVTLTGTLNADGSLTITGTHPGATKPIHYSSQVGGVIN